MQCLTFFICFIFRRKKPDLIKNCLEGQLYPKGKLFYAKPMWAIISGGIAITVLFFVCFYAYNYGNFLYFLVIIKMTK